MPLGVAALDSTSEYSGGDPTNARSLWMFLDNALRHEFDLFPTLSVGPNPSTSDPRRPMENILTPQPNEPGAFVGGFVFSDSTDRGYTFANPATGGNYTLTVDAEVVDVRTATPSTFVSGGVRAARQIQAALRASGHVTATTFSVAYSLTTRKFTVSNSAGSFDMVVKPTDASSCLHSIGFVATTNYTGAATYTAEEARFHTDDWLVMRLDPRIFGPNGSGAEFDAWRFLYQVENTFVGGDYLSRPVGTNLRFDLDVAGIINVDISGVATDTDIDTFLAAIVALVLAAAPSDNVNMMFDTTLERVVVDNSGAGDGLVVTGDADTAWPVLGFTADTSFGILPATADTAPRPFGERGGMTLYIADTVAGLTEQADSAFTDGVDMFDLVGQVGSIFDLTENPAWRGRSSGGQWRRGGSESLRSRYHLADIAEAIGTAPTEIYARIKIVDPNRTEPLSIGALGFTAGFWSVYNAAASTLDWPDRSTLAESVGGSLLPTFENPRATASYEFGPGNPITAEDASLLKSLIRAELDGARVTDWILGNAQPAVVIDPDRVEVPAGNVSAAGLAYGMAYGFISRSPLVEFDGANRFSSVAITFVEAI
jgi:hypothetical protein